VKDDSDAEFSRTPCMNPVPENREGGEGRERNHQEFNKAKTSLLFHC